MLCATIMRYVNVKSIFNKVIFPKFYKITKKNIVINNNNLAVKTTQYTHVYKLYALKNAVVVTLL